jgi:hypothetical protein
MTIKDWKCCINLVEKAEAGYEKIDSNFGSSTVFKILLNSIKCFKGIFHEMKNQLIQETSFLSHLSKS